MFARASLSAIPFLFKTDLITALYQPPNTDYGLPRLGIDEPRNCHEFRDSSAVGDFGDVGDVVEMTDRSDGDEL